MTSVSNLGTKSIDLLPSLVKEASVPVDQTSSSPFVCPPRLSIIIPIYNGAATLRQQLQALSIQDYAGEYEVIAVDNGSTDVSTLVVRSCQQIMPQLRLVCAAEKQGKGYAANVGVRTAKGDAFIFCDQDDIVAPGWLAALARALESCDFVSGRLDETKLNGSAPQRPVFPNGAAKPILGFLPHASGCNFGVSRQAFEAVGGFSEDFPISDDVDLSWRLQLHGYILHDAPEAVVYYRYRQSHRELWQQISGYAEAQVHLYKRYADYGMRRSSIRRALREYSWIIRKIPYLTAGSERKRARWIFRAAASWGRLKGSLRYRRLYL